MQWFLPLALLLLVVAVDAHHVEVEPEPWPPDHYLEGQFHKVSAHPARTINLDMVGSEVAWITPADDDPEQEFYVMWHDLATGEERVVTTIPVGKGFIGVESLAFDGTWIVWADNRFDNLDLFAVNVDTGEFRRVTSDVADDQQVDVREGLIAWTTRDALYLQDLATDERRILVGSVGVEPEPKLTRGEVLWMQPDQQISFIARSPVDHLEMTNLSKRGVGGARFHVDADEDYATWSVVGTLPDPDSAAGYEVVALMQMADLETGQWSNLTTQFIKARDPAIGGGYVTWLELLPDGRTEMVVRHIDSGQTLFLPGPLGRAEHSESHLLVVQAEETFGDMYAISWADLETQVPRGLDWLLVGLLSTGATLIAIGFWLSRRG